MAIMLYSRNDALIDNGPQQGERQLSTGGSSWLWAVTAIYLVSFLAIAILSFRPRHGEKIFHYLFAVALLVGTIAYFAQAAGLAYQVVIQANQTSRGLTRQIHWAKYVFWVVAFPVTSSALSLVSGVSWASIVFNIALIWTWIISYLVAAFTATNYKWGFFIFGTLAWLLVVAGHGMDGRRGAARFGIGRDHSILSGWVGFLWFMYILGWALSDGGNVLSVTGSWIWFGILDIFLLPVIAFGFVFLSSRWDYGAMNLHFTQYGRVPVGHDYPEKSHGHGHGVGGAAAGAALGAGAGHAAANHGTHQTNGSHNVTGTNAGAPSVGPAGTAGTTATAGGPGYASGPGASTTANPGATTTTGPGLDGPTAPGTTYPGT